MVICTECGHRIYLHHRHRNGAFRCKSSGCGCEIPTIPDENPREKGDDDGVEYGDPRDAREERGRW